ncbi:F0F1 ATP synthase subunit delta [Mangrovicoccus algicola]|uniref:ATP synthase subunit delta n=1 Tax=Mangrovicoccus algicola TaxID=2771008 RepID=A0A8J7CGV1_9RHOB|nr:F0F1 ATP synthase subunit delta [Mangrovicoccus algicola]
MSEPAAISSGIAERYATAVFDLAREAGQIPNLESDIEALDAALADSAELSAVISSPVYGRAEQGNAITAVARQMGLSPMLVNTLGLMAAKRRLFVLPQLVRQLQAMIAEEKGEVTAEVTSATELNAGQIEALASAINGKIGKTVKVNMTVDQSLIGGLIVKVGSKMIDTSIRSKLAHLQNAMKEVG